MNDDPREVLAILNSLGFVGITAQQLKAFMKDLKLYRKIKEHEKQQRKEEIKRRIIEKQQNVIKQILREHRGEYQPVGNNVLSSDTTNSYTDNSLIKVQVKCMSNNKENREYESLENNHATSPRSSNVTKSKSKRTPDVCSIKSKNSHADNEISKHVKPRDECLECSKKDLYVSRKYKNKAQSDREVRKEVTVASGPVRPMSAPNILEHDQEPIKSGQTRSTLSTRNSQSGSKSFIRPWRLQPETQKSLTVKKSDPVTLYQKYQQEWKQMSFPGEAKHSGLRWAIRERMLGGDPQPMPLSKKSASMPTLKRK